MNEWGYRAHRNKGNTYSIIEVFSDEKAETIEEYNTVLTTNAESVSRLIGYLWWMLISASRLPALEDDVIGEPWLRTNLPELEEGEK